MTLLNVWIEPDRALVAVDTQGLAPDGSMFEFSKLLTLPHARLLIANRGERIFLSHVFNRMHCAPGALDYDALSAVMVEVLNDTYSHYYEFAKSLGERFTASNQIALVGYSQKAGRILGATYTKTDDAGFSANQIGQMRIMPGDRWPQVPALDNAEAMTWLAREQVVYCKETYPDDPIGGRLLIAELTRDQVTIRSVCDLA